MPGDEVPVPCEFAGDETSTSAYEGRPRLPPHSSAAEDTVGQMHLVGRLPSSRRREAATGTDDAVALEASSVVD
jgi:hypothetical protein